MVWDIFFMFEYLVSQGNGPYYALVVLIEGCRTQDDPIRGTYGT